jgi:hypothetical protein
VFKSLRGAQTTVKIKNWYYMIEYCIRNSLRHAKRMTSTLSADFRPIAGMPFAARLNIHNLDTPKNRQII